MPRAKGSGKNIVEKRVRVTDPKTGKPKTRTYIYARVRYVDPQTGARRAKWRRAANRTDAADKLQELLAEVRAGDPAQAAPPQTFGDLATYYAATSLVPAEYKDNRKIKGRRRPTALFSILARWCEDFKAVPHPTEPRTWTGGVALSSITYDQIDALRLKLHAEPVRVLRVHYVKEAVPGSRRKKKVRIESYDERPRSTATVNHALKLLRNMLNIAARKGWLGTNPFRQGDRPLISAADEVVRKRLLTFDEEERLYAQCVGKRAHLKAIIMCALDTAMRQGEMLKMTVGDYLALRRSARAVTVQQMNTKTLRERDVPVSRRLQAELDRLLEVKLNRPEDRLFGLTTVKRSFAGACRAAGVEGLRFHDLRRTAATRLHRGVPALGIQGMPIGEISRLLGHRSIVTTYRYLAVDEDTTSRAADLFDQIHAQAERVREGAKSRPAA